MNIFLYCNDLLRNGRRVLSTSLTRQCPPMRFNYEIFFYFPHIISLEWRWFVFFLFFTIHLTVQSSVEVTN